MSQSESEPRSPFRETNFESIGNVKLSDAVLSQPCGAIRDLLPGQWSFSRNIGVHSDIETNTLFVDTHDLYLRVANKETPRGRPAIARVQGEIGGIAIVSYVANLSYLQSVLDIQIRIGNADDEFDQLGFDRRRKLHGSELLGGVVLKEFGQVNYYGEEAFAEQAESFTNQLDQFVARLQSAKGTLNIPGIETRRTTIDLATNFSPTNPQIPPAFKRPVE